MSRGQCQVKLVQVACLPAAMCVVNSGVYLGTATGEIFCFDGFELLRTYAVSDLRSAQQTPPVPPLHAFVVSSISLHCLTAVTTTLACNSTASSAPAGKLQQGVQVVAAGVDGSVYGIRLPHVGTAAASSPRDHNEGPSFKLLWSREPHRSIDSPETLCITAMPLLGRSGEMLLASCSPTDGLLLWRPSGAVPRMREMFRQPNAAVQILLGNHNAASVEL